MRLPIKTEKETVDIPEMIEMSEEEYKDYLENELFFTDHNWVIRSGMGEYPIAATRAQLNGSRGQST